MDKKKTLWILAVVLTLLSTFLFSFFQISQDYYGWGIGALRNLSRMFQDPEFFVTADISRMDVVMSAFGIIALFVSEIILIGGIKSEGLSIFGSIMPFILSFYLMFLEFFRPNIAMFYEFAPFLVNRSIGDILPFHVDIVIYQNFPVSVEYHLGLGTYILFVGSICRLISGFIKAYKY